MSFEIENLFQDLEKITLKVIHRNTFGILKNVNDDKMARFALFTKSFGRFEFQKKFRLFEIFLSFIILQDLFLRS